MVPRGSSYVGMYLDMGYDVVVYNYRGYGSSDGTPTPHRLKADGLAVSKIILRTLNSKKTGKNSTDIDEDTNLKPKFILHGQSLGGMVVCHVAAMSPPDSISLLVCDRTFASLVIAINVEYTRTSLWFMCLM